MNTKGTCYDAVEREDDTIFYPQIFKENEAIFHLLFSITPKYRRIEYNRIVPQKTQYAIICILPFLLFVTFHPTHLSQVTCEEEGRNKPKSIKRNTNTEKKNQQKSLHFFQKREKMNA